MVALSTVAIMTVVGQRLVQRSLEAQAHDAEIINLAGRQRMLSQRMARFAGRPGEEGRLTEARRAWERAQERLTRGDLAHFMVAADGTSRLADSAAALAIALEAGDAARAGVAADRYFETMDAQVFAFAAHSREKLATSRALELGLALLTLLTLLVEALWIFRPMLRRVAAAAEAMMEAQAAMARSDALRSMAELAGSLAHDINNFLLVIQLSADILPADGATGEERDAILDTCADAQKLVKQLRSLSDAESAEPEEIHFDELRMDLERLLRRGVPTTMRVEFVAEADLPSVWADPTALLRACFNVARNASDALDGDAGTLRVAASHVELAGESFLEITFSDDGPGMSPEMVERATLPFVSSKLPGVGHGLGLAMVLRTLESGGGTLKIESRLGEGTSVRMRLPARAPATGGVDSLGQARVLVVDDDAGIRRLIDRMLRAEGCSVTLAEDVVSGRRLIEAGEIDLLVSDIVLPDGRGTELAELVRERGEAYPILLITGYSDVEVDPVALRARLLRKPFSRDQFLRETREMVAA